MMYFVIFMVHVDDASKITYLYPYLKVLNPVQGILYRVSRVS